MPPEPDTDEKSDSPIDYLDYHNIVNRSVHLFYWVIYPDVDLFSHSYCFNTDSRPGDT